LAKPSVKIYIGIDVDLINQIAKDQNFKVDLRPLGFDSSIQGVQSLISLLSFLTAIWIPLSKYGSEKSKVFFRSSVILSAKIGTESATFLEQNKDKYGYEIKLYEAADAMYNYRCQSMVLKSQKSFSVHL
jgi:glutamine transport system permease protein